MAKGNGEDLQDDKIKQFKDVVQRISIERFSQEQYFDLIDAIFDDIFNPLTDKEKQ